MTSIQGFLAKQNASNTKILVAFSIKGTGTVMACEENFEESFVDGNLEDIADFGPSVPTKGIWIWEGRIWGEQDNTPDSCDWDTYTSGKWREPTAEEWQKIQKQEDLCGV